MACNHTVSEWEDGRQKIHTCRLAQPTSYITTMETSTDASKKPMSSQTKCYSTRIILALGGI